MEPLHLEFREYWDPRVNGLPLNDVACCRSYFSIGGVTVQIAGNRDADVAFHRELEPFAVSSTTFDIALHVAWVPRLHPARGVRLFDSGTTWRLHESDFGFRFDFGDLAVGGESYKRLFVDAQFSRAALEMDSDFFSRFPEAADPLDYPLDELLIMHRLTQEKAIELHGCGIVRANGVGNLFIGHSGAGKSTTTRLWMEREDVEILSDDRIIVRRAPVARSAVVEMPCEGGGGAGGQQVLRLRESVREERERTRSAQDDRGMRFAAAQDDRVVRGDSAGPILMYGTPWHGEAMFASPNSAALARIFVLEHGYGNVITRLSPSQAVAELFARSFVPFHKHEYIESALSFLEELTNEVPCYRYSFEPDERAVETILNFHD